MSPDDFTSTGVQSRFGLLSMKLYPRSRLVVEFSMREVPARHSNEEGRRVCSVFRLLK